ncbi:MAG TPA: response regulator, partial [Patescibacteria group bacterium]|nr:response regulator [Patescibacteria group bacterium]
MATPLHVLLIEDDEADALLLLRALKKGDYEVTHTRVETEAQVRAELVRAKWDIVISDYVLPGFSGPQALQILKESDLDLPFILLAGQVSTEVAVEVVKSSADDYVSKDRLERLVP